MFTDTAEFLSQVEAAKNHICKEITAKKGSVDIHVAVVLGSGLSSFYERLNNTVVIDYHDIPFMPTTSVSGHAGKLVYGELEGANVLCYAGRVHGYEGYPVSTLTFQTRLAHALGSKTMIVTNASGGCGEGMTPGCVMLLKDHINLVKHSLLGTPVEENHYIDTTDLYSKELSEIAWEVAKQNNVPFHEGVYAVSLGPTYETVAEVLAGKTMGATAFGMSSVPEILTCKSLSIPSMCMCLVSNLASGLNEVELSHEEVKEAADKAGPRFQDLVQGIIKKIVTQVIPKLSLSPSPPRHLSLPILSKIVSPPTKRDIINCSRTFVKKFGKVNGIIFFPPKGKCVMPRTTLVSRHPLSSFPSLPSVSPTLPSLSFSLLSLSLSPSHSLSLLVVENESLIEMGEGDVCHIVRVAAAAGARMLAQVLPGSFPSPGVHVIDDIASFDFRRVTIPHELESYSLSHSLSTLERGSAVSFLGPELPSPTERTFLKNNKFPNWVIGNIFPFQIAQDIKISAYAIASAEKEVEFGGKNIWKVVEKFTNEIGEKLTQEFEREFAGKEEMDHVEVSNEDEGIEEYVPRFIEQEVPQTMGSLEATQAALSSIRQALSLPEGSLSDWVAIFVDGDARDSFNLSLSLSHHKDHVKAPLSLISGHPKDVEGEMHAVPSLKIIAFDGTPELHFGHPLRTLSLSLRAIALSGIKRVVVSGIVESCDDNTGKSSGFAVVKDHALLNGRNPLVGHNVPEFGTRFPDMSGCYDPRAISLSLSSLSLNGFTNPPISVGGCDRFGSGKNNHTKKIISALFLNAMAMGSMVPIIISARHNGLKIAAIAAYDKRDNGKGGKVLLDTAAAMRAEKF